MSDVTDSVNEIEERISTARDGLRQLRELASAERDEPLVAQRIAELYDEISRLTSLLAEPESEAPPFFG